MYYSNIFRMDKKHYFVVFTKRDDKPGIKLKHLVTINLSEESQLTETLLRV